MHWRITLEAIDPIGDDYRKEFMIEKDLDGLTDGKLGCSIDDGKAIMKEVQKIIVERQLDLWVRYCRLRFCKDKARRLLKRCARSAWRSKRSTVGASSTAGCSGPNSRV